MKIEHREKTITVDVYIASDGEEFDNEDDCEAHEHDLIAGTLNFYDADFCEANIDDCLYALTKTKDDVDTLLSLCRYEGITVKGLTTGEPGIYMYLERTDSWLNISRVVAKITEVQE